MNRPCRGGGTGLREGKSEMSFAQNLAELRKYYGLSQEELAGRIGVSRQTLSKYETGESVPDIEKCKILADVLNVSVDALISYDRNKRGKDPGRESDSAFELGVPLKSTHVFGIVRVGDRGEIILPAKARRMFDIRTGDNLIAIGDENHGIALIRERGLLDLLSAARGKKIPK